MIRVSKQDILKIESIHFGHECNGIDLTSSSAINLSKLVNLSKFNHMYSLIIDKIDLN
jgi:hypothetical protein